MNENIDQPYSDDLLTDIILQSEAQKFSTFVIFWNCTSNSREAIYHFIYSHFLSSKSKVQYCNNMILPIKFNKELFSAVGSNLLRNTQQYPRLSTSQQKGTNENTVKKNDTDTCQLRRRVARLTHHNSVTPDSWSAEGVKALTDHKHRSSPIQKQHI